MCHSCYRSTLVYAIIATDPPRYVPFSLQIHSGMCHFSYRSTPVCAILATDPPRYVPFSLQIHPGMCHSRYRSTPICAILATDPPRYVPLQLQIHPIIVTPNVTAMFSIIYSRQGRDCVFVCSGLVMAQHSSPG